MPATFLSTPASVSTTPFPPPPVRRSTSTGAETASQAERPTAVDHGALRLHVDTGGQTLALASALVGLVWVGLLPLDLIHIQSQTALVVASAARVVPAACLALVGLAHWRREQWLAARSGRQVVFWLAAMLLAAHLALVAVHEGNLGQADLVAGVAGTCVLLFVKVPLWWKTLLVGGFYLAFVAITAASGMEGLELLPLGIHLLGALLVSVAGSVHLDRTFNLTYNIVRTGQVREQSMAQTIERSRTTQQRLELAASLDPLTGTLNRRAFFDQACTHLTSGRPIGGSTAALVIDADRFKAINDTHGHAVGDQVLEELTVRLGRALRSGDLMGRIGGEEFAVLLPGSCESRAAEIAERLRQEAGTRPCHTTSGPIPVTVSIGVAIHAEGESLRSLLARADLAMYEAKRAGGNQVEIAAPEPL